MIQPAQMSSVSLNEAHDGSIHLWSLIYYLRHQNAKTLSIECLHSLEVGLPYSESNCVTSFFSRHFPDEAVVPLPQYLSF